ncbi:hypothetical protein Sjap_025167 [Stephania japonica]|uniref:ENTH domain-containing protein n=1 Tax=Stephania japonica TaxID=461633 RepID=A0AAP0E1C2_9MAGN
MPSKFRKAIGAVKDHTSIGIAKVSKTPSSVLDVPILKATTHDEFPVDDRYVSDIINYLSSTTPSSSTFTSTSCAHAIAKRLSRTRNWVVATKCLYVLLRLFQHGGYNSHFPHHLVTFALYLDERLQSHLKNKIVIPNKEDKPFNVKDVPLETLLDRIFCWQRMIDRIVATEPTGAAKGNRLVQTCLYAVVKESFDLYQDVSNGLNVLLDSFYQLDYQHCVDAYQVCVKAAKQFEELSSFYTLCRSIDVGRVSEYPTVETISDVVVESLHDFLRNKSNSLHGSTSTSHNNVSNGWPSTSSTSSQVPHQMHHNADVSEPSTPFNPREGNNFSETCSERYYSEEGSNSLGGTSSSAYNYNDDEIARTNSNNSDHYGVEDNSLWSSNPPESNSELESDSERMSSKSTSIDRERYSVNSHIDDFVDVNESKGREIVINEVEQDKPEPQKQQPAQVVSDGAREGWELELVKTAGDISLTDHKKHDNVVMNTFEPNSATEFFECDQVHEHGQQQPTYVNPFSESEASTPPPTGGSSAANIHDSNNSFSSFEMLLVTPTFSASNPNETTTSMQIENDPFAPVDDPNDVPNGSISTQQLQKEQQLWLQQQSKIIARHMSCN